MFCLYGSSTAIGQQLYQGPGPKNGSACSDGYSPFALLAAASPRHKFPKKDPCPFNALFGPTHNSPRIYQSFCHPLRTRKPTIFFRTKGDFVALEKVFVGVGNNVHAALEVTNGTAAKNRERLQYFRKLSNEYTDVRRTGILALLASFVAAGAIGFVGVSAGISTNKSLTPCESVRQSYWIHATVAKYNVPAPESGYQDRRFKRAVGGGIPVDTTCSRCVRDSP